MSEVNGVGALFLALFFFSLLGFYITIRRGLLSTLSAGVLCAVTSVVSLAMFGIIDDSIDNGLAVTGSLVVGLTFTGMMVTMASFFQSNQPKNLKAYDAMLRDREQNDEA